MSDSRLRIKLQQIASVTKNEFRSVFTDGGVILVLIGALLIYSTIYAFAYRNEVLRDIPVAIVDNNNTASSRELIRNFDATPNLRVAYKAQSLQQAKELLLKRKINGVVVIPSDYEKKLLRTELITIAVYADASYFLIYRQVFNDVLVSMMHRNYDIQLNRFTAKGIDIKRAEAMSDPVEVKVENMFNPYVGYATFILPPILILMIQQTLLIGIGMVGGTWREQRLYHKLIVRGEKYLATIPLVLGKALAYFVIDSVLMIYLFGIQYPLFDYPMNGEFVDIFLFLIPYLLACIFLAIAISTLFKSRENSLLAMIFTSIPLIMLSGASLPVEAMPHWLYKVGKIFPSSSGIEGFLQIQTMGATLNDVASSWKILWILSIVFFALACLGTKRVIKHHSNDL